MSASAELDYRHVVELFPDAVVAARGETIVFVNPAAEGLLGWSRAQLIGKPLVTIIPERLREAHARGLARYRATGVPRVIGRPVRVPALRSDGSEVDIELTIGAFSSEADSMYIASLRDLRDRVELERQLAIGAQLRHVTRAAATMIASLDLDSVVRVATETLARDFGAALARIWIVNEDRRTLILRASAGLSQATRESSRASIDIETYRYKVGHVARTLKPLIKNDLLGDQDFEQDWIAREGLVSVAAMPVHAGDELRGVMIAFFRQPVSSEVIDLIETFAAMVAAAVNDVRLVEELRSAINARDHFLSMASHELNTPLTTLKLQLESIARSARDDAPVAERVQRAQKQATRLASLVNDLLDVSRIASGRLRLRVERFDLTSLVSEILDRHAIDLEVARCELQTNLAPDVVGVWDRDRIDQVITNLIGNAIKYGVGQPIAVTVSAADDVARVVVRDEGIGIARPDQARIFERFERATRGAKQPGLGLGLWIASEIVGAHGGRLSVDSDVGRGATFVAELPLNAPRATDSSP